MPRPGPIQCPINTSAARAKLGWQACGGWGGGRQPHGNRPADASCSSVTDISDRNNGDKKFTKIILIVANGFAIEYNMWDRVVHNVDIIP